MDFTAYDLNKDHPLAWNLDHYGLHIIVPESSLQDFLLEAFDRKNNDRWNLSPDQNDSRSF